jgi:hypothetical protein
MNRTWLISLVLAACAAPGTEWPGAAHDAELRPLLEHPPVARLALHDGAGNAAVLAGGRLLTVRHLLDGRTSRTLRVDGRDSGFTLLAQGEGGPADDWALLALDEPGLLEPLAILPAASAPSPGQAFVIVGWVPEAGATREEQRRLVALRGRIVEPPWLLREAARGAVGLEFEQEPPDYHGLSGSPVLVREASGWRLCGVYSGRLEAWPWCALHLATPLPGFAGGSGEPACRPRDAGDP